MSTAPSREQQIASPPIKLSVSTLYPMHLPRLDFYTQRAIHQNPPDHCHPPRQVPITYLRYLRSKQRRFSSRSDAPASPTLLNSMLITNAKESSSNEENEDTRLHMLQEQRKARFGHLLEKMSARRQRDKNKDKEVKSTVLLNYYKKKFLKYRCRKSIDLDPKMEVIRKSNHQDLLANGLKIEKIQVNEAPKAVKEIINRAKFNTLICEGEGRRAKRYEIGPWARFQTQPWGQGEEKQWH